MGAAIQIGRSVVGTAYWARGYAIAPEVIPARDLVETHLIARHPRVLDIVADIFRGPANLFDEHVIIDAAAAEHSVLHQDYIAEWQYVPAPAPGLLRALIPLSTPAVVEVCPSMHREHADFAGSMPPIDHHVAPGDLVLLHSLAPYRLVAGRWLALAFNAAPYGDLSGIHQRHQR